MIRRSKSTKRLASFLEILASRRKMYTLESGIDVGQGINVGPGKLGKKNKRRALNTHVLCSE